jgi:hypothetical protein
MKEKKRRKEEETKPSRKERMFKVQTKPNSLKGQKRKEESSIEASSSPRGKMSDYRCTRNFSNPMGARLKCTAHRHPSINAHQNLKRVQEFFEDLFDISVEQHP